MASLSSAASKAEGFISVANTRFSKFPVSSDFRSRNKSYRERHNTKTVGSKSLDMDFVTSKKGALCLNRVWVRTYLSVGCFVSGYQGNSLPHGAMAQEFNNG